MITYNHTPAQHPDTIILTMESNPNNTLSHDKSFAIFSPCQSVKIIGNSVKNPFAIYKQMTELTIYEFRAICRRLIRKDGVKKIYVDMDYNLPYDKLEEFEQEVNVPIVVYANYCKGNAPNKNA